MGSRGGQQAAGTQTTYLPPEQQTNVDLLMKGARDFLASGGPQYYQGSTVAGVDPLQTQGRAQQVDYANNVGRQLAGDVVANDRFWLNPNNIFNPSNIPGFAEAQRGLTQNVTRNFTESIMPELTGTAAAGGALGSSRAGLTSALAATRTNEALAQQLAQMNMDAYSQGLQMNNAAAARAPQTMMVGAAPGAMLESVGAQNRADQQQQINADMDRWNYEQLRPLNVLQAFQQLTGTAGQYGGTVSSNQQQTATGSNPLQGVGAALALASLFMPRREPQGEAA